LLDAVTVLRRLPSGVAFVELALILHAVLFFLSDDDSTTHMKKDRIDCIARQMIIVDTILEDYINTQFDIYMDANSFSFLSQSTVLIERCMKRRRRPAIQPGQTDVDTYPQRASVVCVVALLSERERASESPTHAFTHSAYFFDPLTRVWLH
jgi:hypothetical protein